MNLRVFKAIAFAVLLVLIFTAGAGFCAENQSKITQFALKKDPSGALVADFVVSDIATKELTDTLDSGLPVRFIYRARLSRSAKLFLGGVLADVQFERLLEKDNLKNTFKITQDGQVQEFKSLVSALEYMSGVRDFYIVGASELLRREKYMVEVQVKLEEFRLPFYLHRIFPIFGMWDQTTPWVSAPVAKELYASP